jgi:hypothetical protein
MDACEMVLEELQFDWIRLFWPHTINTLICEPDLVIVLPQLARN